MPKTADPKEHYLREHGTLNTHPVQDELFAASEFFDPKDLVQVKYEMLRRVHQEGASVSQAAGAFGFSRPSFYKTQDAFERGGVSGLVPRKRGPRGGHKLTEEILGFAQRVRAAGDTVPIPALLRVIEERFGVRVHRRSLERGLARRGKKTP